jgi:SAM-dependent methyltransferase
MKKWMYEFIYGNRSNSIPWEEGTHEGLLMLVESGRVKPCRAVDLGCGTARNVVYLAQHGFDVTGVDFIPAAIELGRARARDAEVEANIIVDDLTNLQHINGAFDLLVDYGTLDDLSPPHRDLYMQNILPLTHPGSMFLLVCGEWSSRWWERLFLDGAALAPGEVEGRFGDYFEIEVISKIETGSTFMPMWATYLMTRK